MDVLALQSRLKDLDKEISERTSELYSNVSKETRHELDASREEGDFVDWLNPELVNKLWLLKNSYSEAQDLFDQDETTSCSQSLENVISRVAEFEADYPNTLLAVDVTRKVNHLQARVSDLFLENWHRIIQWNTNHLTVEYKRVKEPSAILNSCAQLTEMFVHRELGETIIKPMLELKIQIKHSGSKLTWNQDTTASLNELLASVQALVSFCSLLPEPLAQKIPRRWGTYLVSQLIRVSIPKLYPDQPTVPEFKKQLSMFTGLDAELKSHGWSGSNEISQFISNFDSNWVNVRREKFLTKLRELYHKATPVSEESRYSLVAEFRSDENEKDTAQDPADDADGWDWDGDDEEEEEEEASNAGNNNEKQDPVGANEKGHTVDLWNSYSTELAAQSPEPFFTLYRAITPTAYDNNHLWIYTDTFSFICHINTKTQHPDISQLSNFANENLHKYVSHYMDMMEFEVLPKLFGSQSISSEAIGQIKSTIDEVAMDTNNAGGPGLRQSVLSQLVEQIAVYIIRTVEELPDVGDSESQNLATTILKLNSLAVYFDDPTASVPSWNKLDMLKEMLTSNLATIEDLHSRGMLADFTGEELTILVKALFVDSAMRANVIRKFNQ